MNGAALVIALGAGCLAIFAAELRAGVTGTQDGVIRRAEAPAGFWIVLGAQALSGLGLMFFAAML